MPRFGSLRRESGQAAVEVAALLPLLAVLVAVAWQAVLAGQAIWLSGSASRAAARAQAVGGDPARAARGVLPARLADGLRVRSRGEDGDGVRVEIPVPLVLGGGRLATVAASARFAPQER